MSILIAEKDLPQELTPIQAIDAAYASELAEVASKLQRGLPALVECDKDLALFLYTRLRDRLWDRQRKTGLEFVCIDGHSGVLVDNKNPTPQTGIPGMAAGRYQSPRSLIESATSWENDLNRAVGARLREFGIPEDMIGLRGLPGIDEGRAFVRFPDTQIGGNLNPAVNPAWFPGIALDHGVLDVAHPHMGKVPAWSQRTTVLRDRVDAAIVHEYIEATLTPPQGLSGPTCVEWLHKEAIRRAPDTTLPITERAREILRQYRSAEGLAT